VGKVRHVRIKDATALWDVVRRQGILGSEPFVFHRTPGFGETNWTDVISELRRGGYSGAIDIEGWDDPVYRDMLGMTGRVDDQAGAWSSLPEALPRRRFRAKSLCFH